MNFNFFQDIKLLNNKISKKKKIFRLNSIINFIAFQ